MLNLDTYLIKEKVGLLKLVDTYEIFDPNTGVLIGVAKEEPGNFIAILRLAINKKLLPTSVVIYDQAGQVQFSIHRGISFLRSKVDIRGADNDLIGYFKSKLFSLGGGFHVYDRNDTLFADVKGDWKGWNFKFLTSGGQVMGTVTKKWAGMAKELFTSADSYIIAIDKSVQAKEGGNMLLLAAGLAIDIIYKEGP